MDTTIGSMFHAQLQILATVYLFLFLHHSVLTFAANFPTPNNSPLIHNNNLPTSNSVPYYYVKIPKMVFFPLGVVNTIATAVIIIITLLNIIVYKLRQLHEANFGNNLDISSSSSQQLQKENLGENSSIPSSLKSEQLCRHFSLAEILSATNNFDDTLVIGHGGFGKVYKGVIDNRTVTVAIKRLSPMSKQGAPQFWTEDELLSKFRHSHLVSLIGYCNNCDEMILVYEYMARGALADHLYKLRPDGNTLNLSWVQRLKICIGAAQGLDYLHTGTGIHDRVIHRDLKSSNILLDDSWAAKVSDFGLSKIGPANQSSTHVSTNIKGTFGYVDPEYLLTRRLTRKSDVYSFGVVLLEVLSGRQAVDLKLREEQWGLAGWAKECIKKGELDQIIDPSLKWQILPNSLMAFVQIADQCLHYRSKKRPTMAEVVTSLESALALQERRDSSMFEEDIFNVGGTFDNLENPDYSFGQPEVINAGNGEHQGEEIDNIVLSGDASSLQSRVRPARMTPFKRMAQLFFFGRSRGLPPPGPVPTDVSPPSPGLPLNFSCLGEAFTFQQILQATGDLSAENVIKHGHSGDLFRGILEGGIPVVIKKIDLGSVKKEAYMIELDVFSKVSHRQIVPLLGHCLENENEKFLVYKYMPNGDLSSSLFRKTNTDDDTLPSLDWITRLKIATGAAGSLSYLHHECTPPLVHRDVQASSILIDDKFEVRLGSLSEVCAQEGDTLQSMITRLVRLPQRSEQGASGTPTATCAYDVYCFGKVLLELVTGKLGISLSTNGTSKEWLEAMLPYISIYNKELVTNIVDPSLIIDEDLLEEVWAMAIVARSCLNPKSSRRPLMRYILEALENPLKVVREESTSSARLRATSSRGSWNTAQFGSWQHSSSDVAAIPAGPANKAEGGSRTTGSQGSGGQNGGADNSSSTRRHSREICPEPLYVQDVERLHED